MRVIGIRIKLNGLLKGGGGFAGPAILRRRDAKGDLGFGEAGIKFPCRGRSSENLGNGYVVTMPGAQPRIGQGNSSKRLGVPGPAFALGRALKQAAREFERRPGSDMEELAPLEIAVIGIEFHARRMFCGQLPRQQFDAKLLDNGPGDFILQGKDVGELPVIAIGPEMGPGNAVGELRGNSHPLPGFPDAAFENRAGIEPVAHLADIRRLALVGKHRIARDHTDAGKSSRGR